MLKCHYLFFKLGVFEICGHAIVVPRCYGGGTHCLIKAANAAKIRVSITLSEYGLVVPRRYFIGRAHLEHLLLHRSLHKKLSSCAVDGNHPHPTITRYDTVFRIS